MMNYIKYIYVFILYYLFIYFIYEFIFLLLKHNCHVLFLLIDVQYLSFFICNINTFTDTFDQFKASLINKS